MSTGLITYLSVVGGITLLLAVRMLFWLRGVELRSLARFRRRPNSRAVETTTPLDDPKKRADQIGVDSISSTFSVTRRLLFPLLFGTAGVAAVIPFLTTVPATVVTLMVAVVTVGAGVLLRPLIENSISGLVVSSSRLVNIGDTLVIEGHYGTVEDITVTHTTIKLWDWRRFVVSNNRMLQLDFINLSLFDNYVWSYVEFWVDYTADLEEVERLAVEAAQASSVFGGHEEPRFWLIDTAPEGIKCWIAAWTDSPADSWQMKHDIRVRLAPGLAARGWAPRGHRVRVVHDAARGALAL